MSVRDLVEEWVGNREERAKQVREMVEVYEKILREKQLSGGEKKNGN